MKTIKTMFTPLLKENSMKHIDYKTFNSIQVMMMMMIIGLLIIGMRHYDILKFFSPKQ